MVTVSSLKSHLLRNHDAQQLAQVPLTFTFVMTNTRLSFAIQDQALIALAEDEATDVEIHVGSAEQALALFEGQTPIMEAFMTGQLRSSGYLMWVFRIIFAFLPTR